MDFGRGYNVLSTECLWTPTNSYIESLIPNLLVFEVGPLGVIKFK